MMSDMAFRQPVDADLPALARLHVLCWQEAYKGLMPDQFLRDLSVEQRLAGWRRSLADPDVFAHAAFDGEGPVGFITAGPIRDARPGLGDGEIYAIYVRAFAHRRGIGRRLLGAAARHWRSRGGSGLTVLCIAGNKPAEAFYMANGGHKAWSGNFELGGQTYLENAFQFADIQGLALPG
jgi:GNAT superfamily N-acetyltransferase